jgi:vacuolar-type H+-ATPase subunit H
MKKTKDILSKIELLKEKKPDIVKEAAEKALRRMYPHIKVSEETLVGIVNRMKKTAYIDPIREPLLKRIFEKLRRVKAPTQKFFGEATDALGRAAKATSSRVSTEAKKLVSDMATSGELLGEHVKKNVIKPGKKAIKDFYNMKGNPDRLGVGNTIDALHPAAEGLESSLYSVGNPLNTPINIPKAKSTPELEYYKTIFGDGAAYKKPKRAPRKSP